MPIEILDPTHEAHGPAIRRAPRLDTLRDTTIGIVSNGKKGTAFFFDVLARELESRFAVREIVRVTKSNYSAPVDAALLHDAGRWHAMIAGIGD